MDFRLSGLPAAPFLPLFGLDDAALLARGARRLIAQPGGPAMPCRISLRDAAPGEAAILLHHAHLDAPRSPYRAGGPIFVRHDARETASVVNTVPDQQRSRLLSVRGYDQDDMLLDADVAPGTELEALIARLLGRREIAYLHVHNARHGCYACRVDRA